MGKRFLSGVVVRALLCVAWCSLFTSPSVFAYGVGDVVQLSAGTNVRVSAAGALAPCSPNPQPVGSRGTVTSGPVSALLNGVNYQWVAIDWAGSACDGWSVVNYLTSATTTPTTPTLLSPTDGKLWPGGTTSVALSWAPVTGARGYNVSVSTGSCSGPAFSGATTPEASFTVFGLSEGISYYWKAQAVGDSSPSAYSACRSVQVMSTAALTLTSVTAQTIALRRGESTTFTLQVSGPSGNPVQGAVVVRSDGVSGVNFATAATDLSGRTSYTVSVPALRGIGAYTIDFRATRSGYAESEIVARQVAIIEPPPVLDAGLPTLTVITHGFNSGTDDWLDQMAEAISRRRGGVPIATLTIDNRGERLDWGFDLLTIPPDTLDLSTGKGLILKVDWSRLDAGVGAGCDFRYDGFFQVPTGLVASQIAGYLDSKPELLALPIHLIGHSRGGSVMTGVASALDTIGVWIDQLTTLDPHPVTPFDYSVVQTPDNVLFADNYWREGWGGFDGQRVPGARPTDLNVPLEPLEYWWSPFTTPAHSAVHTYYHGTIDISAETDGAGSGTGTSIDTNWYQGEGIGRATTGYYWSRNGGGLKARERDLTVSFPVKQTVHSETAPLMMTSAET